MNILITRHDKIGDFITTLPLFFVLKKHNPNNKIYALVAKINIELARQIDFIDEVILYDKNHFLQTLNHIKQAKIDVSISAFIDTKLGILLALSGIKKRIAPATKIAQLFFNKTLKQSRSQVKKTEALYNLDLAKALDEKIDLSFKKPLLTLPKNNTFRALHHIDSQQEIIIFHPGYGGSSDGNLGLKDYLTLAKIANKMDNIQVVWTFGADDDQTKQSIQTLVDETMIIYQPPTLLDFCHLINHSKLLISTSTGPMHLAAALNIHTISFFGDNLFASPKRWASVSDEGKQHNFVINKHFKLIDVENTLKQL